MLSIIASDKLGDRPCVKNFQAALFTKTIDQEKNDNEKRNERIREDKE